MSDFKQMADELVGKSRIASAVFNELDQAQTDKIVEAVCKAAVKNRVKLAKLAAEETKLGVWQHKVIKNFVASQLVYESIRDEKTAGIIAKNEITGITEIAQPMGPILGVIPITNPTSTVMFKSLICLKSRNPIIISPHSRALGCSGEAARICYEAALEAGAPDDCVQWLSVCDRDLTHELMTHPKLALLLATGGPGLVKAAYSSGTPAYGVGSGNVPVFIEKSADIKFAVENIILSKTFDNGTVCASEQAIVVETNQADAVRSEFERQGCFFMTDEQMSKVEKIVINPKSGLMSAAVVGQSAKKIAELSEIDIPDNTKILMAPQTSIGKDYPFSGEILAPVLAFYVGKDFSDALKICVDLNYRGGIGHTASIYSNDENKVDQFAELMNAGRVVVNTPSSQGGVGGIYNMLKTSLTLGCGAGGKNITTENVSARHLINIKRLCHRRDNVRMQRITEEMFCDESIDYDQLASAYNRNL